RHPGRAGSITRTGDDAEEHGADVRVVADRAAAGETAAGSTGETASETGGETATDAITAETALSPDAATSTLPPS
ncbi:MAG: hypothetical protein WCC60_22905, partial [Ilumatobacteraceae bacterium]